MTEQERLQKETNHLKNMMVENQKLYKTYLKELNKEDFNSKTSIVNNVNNKFDAYVGEVNKYIEDVTPNAGASRFSLYANLVESYTEFRNLRDEYIDKLMS